VVPIYQDDINLVAGGWSWLKRDILLPTISLDSCIMLKFGLSNGQKYTGFRL
jgi:hypothetical protein